MCYHCFEAKGSHENRDCGKCCFCGSPRGQSISEQSLDTLRAKTLEVKLKAAELQISDLRAQHAAASGGMTGFAKMLDEQKTKNQELQKKLDAKTLEARLLNTAIDKSNEALAEEVGNKDRIIKLTEDLQAANRLVEVLQNHLDRIAHFTLDMEYYGPGESPAKACQAEAYEALDKIPSKIIKRLCATCGVDAKDHDEETCRAERLH